MKTTNPASNWQSMETAMIAVEPDGLDIQSTNPQWDRARAILAGIKTTLRMNLAGQIVLGGELIALKAAFKFNGSGRRKESPHDGDFLTHRTWQELLTAELGISDSTADRFIACFKIVQNRAKKLGDESQPYRLLSAAPSSLSGDDRKKLGEIVNLLVSGESQKELLQDLKIVSGKSTKTAIKPKPKKADPGKLKVIASISFKNIYNDLKKLSDDVRYLLDHKEFSCRLYALSLIAEKDEDLTDSEQAEIIGLLDYRESLSQIKLSIDRDTKSLLESVGKAIDAKMAGEAPKRIRNKTSTTR